MRVNKKINNRKKRIFIIIILETPKFRWRKELSKHCCTQQGHKIYENEANKQKLKWMEVSPKNSRWSAKLWYSWDWGMAGVINISTTKHRIATPHAVTVRFLIWDSSSIKIKLLIYCGFSFALLVFEIFLSTELAGSTVDPIVLRTTGSSTTKFRKQGINPRLEQAQRVVKFHNSNRIGQSLD